MKKMNKKGFTIVELVIVIAVIAILAAVMIPTFSGIVDRANKSAALQEVTNAYKEAYAIALSDDGIVTGNSEEETVGEWKFTFTMTNNALGVQVTAKPSKYSSTNFTFASGKWTVS